MNSVNTLLNQNIPFPVHWFISTPSLYGTNVMWDIIGGRSATLYDKVNNGTIWKPYSNKPGSLGGCVSTASSLDLGYIDISHTVRKSFTMMCWAKINSSGSNGYFLSTAANSLRMISSQPNKVTINGTTYSTITFNYEEWTHFALTVNFTASTNSNGYINGKFAVAGNQASSLSSAVIRSVGNQSTSPQTSRQIFGDFDDIMIFDSILSEETIRSIYKNSFTRKVQMSQFLMSQGSTYSESLFNMLMGGQF